MGRFNDRLRAAVSQQPNTRATLKLSDQDSLELMSRPLRSSDMQAISRQHPDFASNPTTSGMIDLLILKCRDPETEEPAFDVKDKPLLSALKIGDISAVFHDLFGEQLQTSSDDLVENHKGN